MKVGYARVSTLDQNLDLQTDALKKEGCKEIFEDHASGAKADRDGLRKALEFIREGDTLVVWKLDRLSRSLKDLLIILEKIEQAGAGFQSLTEAIDTTVPAGRMMMQMLGSFAEFERTIIRERTRAGLEQARARGHLPGRKPKLSPDQRMEIVEAVTSGRKTGAEVARLFNVHRATVSRIIAQERTPI